MAVRLEIVLQRFSCVAIQWSAVGSKKKLYCNTLLCIVTGSGARGEAVSRHGQARTAGHCDTALDARLGTQGAW